tara:strand:+ start:2380 stop:3111 length:732 start_codon:yes stop_codon:yes gene_type:complete
VNGIDPYQVRELIEDYNSNPQRYSDGEAETIAVLAQAIGARFQRDGKPFQKGLFDVLDTATFDLLPNELRPTSRGESVFGETDAEQLASALGIGAGVVGGIGGAYKGGRGLFNYFKKKKGRKGGSDPISNVREQTKSNVREQTKLLGEPQRLLSGQTSRQTRRNRFPLDSRSGNPIPMTSRAGDPIPMGGDTLSKIREFEYNMGIGDSYFDTQKLINYAGLNIKPNQLTRSQRNEIIQRLMDS